MIMSDVLPEGILTVRQWAEQLGVSRAWVYQMIKRSGIQPAVVGPQWLLTPVDRTLILARPRGKPGRPRKVLTPEP
jgi:excisionase family DNA binding protein